MKRYHPILVVFHWLLAVLIIIGLIMGGNVLSTTPNTAPEKIFYLKMHMSAGMVILVLMIIRIIIRFITTKPPHTDIGNTLLNKLAVSTHFVFYLIVILMGISGIAIANLAGLPDIVFNGSGVALPATFDEYPPRIAHGVLSYILKVLIAGHFAAFIYHQFIRKDNLFSKMWFGQR